ncbi:hypothetical protein NKH18_24565 [Streptomyces sp. M10(2022)]
MGTVSRSTSATRTTNPTPGPVRRQRPGHTQAFSINEDPYGDGNTYQAGQAPHTRQARACTGSSC